MTCWVIFDVHFTPCYISRATCLSHVWFLRNPLRAEMTRRWLWRSTLFEQKESIKELTVGVQNMQIVSSLNEIKNNFRPGGLWAWCSETGFPPCLFMRLTFTTSFSPFKLWGSDLTGFFLFLFQSLESTRRMMELCEQVSRSLVTVNMANLLSLSEECVSQQHMKWKHLKRPAGYKGKERCRSSLSCGFVSFSGEGNLGE